MIQVCKDSTSFHLNHVSYMAQIMRRKWGTEKKKKKSQISNYKPASLLAVAVSHKDPPCSPSYTFLGVEHLKVVASVNP